MKYTDLTGKTAIVTGSARGIGFESAKLMAEAGACVVICDINEDGAKASAKELLDEGLNALALPVNVQSEASIINLLEETQKQTGRIDILVNNAGILDPTSIPEMTLEKWDRMLEINLRGAQLCSQHVVPIMAKSGKGKIVNMSSQAGQLGGFLAGVHYSAAKGGVLALTKAYARYCAQFQINVNCVSPGFMLTDMTKDRGDDPEIIPLKRLGTALDAAKAVFFLVTELSDYITGTTLDVNGGYYLR